MIFERGGAKSIFEIYNKTYSRGGARLLDGMFRNPLSEYEKIKKRIDNILFFKQHVVTFPFTGSMFDVIEFYLNNNDQRTQLAEKNLKTIVSGDPESAWIHNGIAGCLEMLVNLKYLLVVLKQNGYEDNDGDVSELERILETPELSECIGYNGKKISMKHSILMDSIFRFSHRDKILRVLSYIFQFDVYISVANVAIERGYCFATVYSEDANMLKLKGVYHPLLDNPVGNDLEIDGGSNVIFLTGANMAGKSTIMKTISVALFLAHVGFPIPAQSMSFSVRRGMFTTINLPDNLSHGYSHFYTEVLRVKKVGESLNNTGKLVVVFDELFRGTNVKDAYDATLAVTAAFAQNRDSLFIISTHITEVGAALKKLCDNVRYLYMPTVMEGTKPIYPYRLAEGVTADRHGMVIVNNEKIVEIIKGEYHDF